MLVATSGELNCVIVLCMKFSPKTALNAIWAELKFQNSPGGIAFGNH